MDSPIDIGSRLELFVDDLLVDTLFGTTHRMHTPVPMPMPKSPVTGSYLTVFIDNDEYRAYYRTYDPAYTDDKYDGNVGELTCYAHSSDGIEWQMPELGLCEVGGSTRNNVLLSKYPPFCHNFSPFRDRNPAAADKAKYKALAGAHSKTAHGSGLHAFQSEDGLHWTPMHKDAVITSNDADFDSQNVSFWSETEQCYVCYFRTWVTPHGRLRTISRTTSSDYINWTEPVAMNPNLPGEHIYTSQAHPYFRAPHIYIALPTRFQFKRLCSTDILFMTTRAGTNHFDRLFTEAFIRPGLDPERWGNRSNYVACGVVPTGPDEMSIYHSRSGRRYVLRTDGFVSINAGARPGEMVTRPLTFTGSELVCNYSTSAAGSIAVEILDEKCKPIEGFTREDAQDLIGDAIEQPVAWRENPKLESLAGRPIRLRFLMHEADLYSIRFR